MPGTRSDESDGASPSEQAHDEQSDHRVHHPRKCLDEGILGLARIPPACPRSEDEVGRNEPRRLDRKEEKKDADERKIDAGLPMNGGPGEVVGSPPGACSCWLDHVGVVGHGTGHVDTGSGSSIPFGYE